MKLVKAEILFSRKCNLKCKHCAMVTQEENTLSIEEWKKGILNLKDMGCSFCAFYGAEPMLEFDKLKEVVGFTEQQGIKTTVITSGVGIPNFKDRITDLHAWGAKSLSMSYDLIPYCKSSENKTEGTIESLNYFKSLGNVRDVAAITVLHAKNYHLLPLMIKTMSYHGIWTFFDIIHEDMGHLGTKCKGKANGLMFEERHLANLFEILDLVSRMKEDGFLVHNNDTFIEELKNNWKRGKNFYSWCCANHKEFPSWLTIDCDGRILPCDDFNVNSTKWNISTVEKDDWEEMIATFKKQILSNYCSCAWNTHIGAHSIKSGKDSIKDYIHGDWNE